MLIYIDCKIELFYMTIIRIAHTLAMILISALNMCTFYLYEVNCKKKVVFVSQFHYSVMNNVQ